LAQRQKANAGAYRQFKKDLSAGRLGRLYLFYGEETYLRDYYLNQMKKSLLRPGSEAFNFHILQARECSVRALEEAVNALPMMSERTLIAVYDYDLYKLPEAARAAATYVLNDLPDYVCLVFLYDLIPYKPDGRTKLAAVIKANGSAVEFTRQEQGDLVDWIRRRFHALDHDIDSRLCEYLISLCGDLMNGLISEISKIGAYAKNRVITQADIDAVATPQLDAVVFRMVDGVTAGNYDQAAVVLSDLLHMNEPPIRILAAFSTQLRQLYCARLVLEDRKGVGELMELCQMRSAYPARKLMGAAPRFSLTWCRAAVCAAAETDLAMKSVSGADGGKLLIDLLLKLAQMKPK
jgi:DNA polymerase-3 subunit delta